MDECGVRINDAGRANFGEKIDSRFRGFRALQFQRSRINAVAHSACGGGPVVKHVPQMGFAACAFRFRANHSMARVRLFLNASRRERSGKARPTGAGFKFRSRFKQRLSARRTHVRTGFLRVAIFPREGRLRTLLPHYIILFRRKFFLPLRVGLLYFFGHSEFSLSQALKFRKESSSTDIRVGALLKLGAQFSQLICSARDCHERFR